MKKYLVFLMLLATTLISTAARAQAYVSTDAGFSHLDIDCNGLSCCSQNSTTYKIIGGYRFGYGFAGEVATSSSDA